MRAFDRLIEEFLREWFEEHPASATFLGVEGYDDRLGDFSAASFERRDEQAAAWVDRFAAAGAGDPLSPDEEIDRDLVVSTLRGNLIVSDWQVWRRNPDVYLGPCLNGVFGLFLHRLYPDDELAALAAARLRQVPSVLEAGRANLAGDLASPVFVQRAIGQCRAGVAYAREMVPAEVPGSSDLADAGAAAASAFESFAAWLESELLPSATGEYALGADRYSRLLQEKELLGHGVDQLRERGRAAYDELDAEMRGVAAVVGGREDWRSVVEEVNQDHPSSPEEMRREYEEWTARARAFLAEHDLVTFPDGERCEVVPSPPFQRPILAVASYFRPPAFRPSLTGRFNVPFPPEGVSDEEIQKRLQTNSRASIPTISVHEAYPGHHWHLVTAQQTPRVVRKVLSSAYFAEGWGLYSERMMREEGFFADPRHELGHLDARIFRAARIVVDTSLHIGDMEFEEAVTFMTTKAGLSEPTARAEVGRYCTWPTQAASYLTGSLEIERMRSSWLDGGGSLKDFHDKIAGTGVLPIALAERALFER